MIGMLRLVESSSAKEFGRHREVPPVSDLKLCARYPAIAIIFIVAATLVPANRLTSPSVITATCAALLIGGLPHGALDLAVLRRDAGDRMTMVIGLYLSLAAMMFATWQVAPVLALALFLAMAMTHFADDWSDSEHPFFALGIAVALLSAPALLHHGAVSGLFVLLSGKPAAAGLADALLLAAPAAVACALLATLLLWHRGHRIAAANAACALAAMILLPPITGFAIYFCLIHSPSHFRAGLKRLGSVSSVTQPTIVATLGGLTIALATVQFLPLADLSSRLFAASFITLSILTLPHMAVPLILRRFGLNTRD